MKSMLHRCCSAWSRRPQGRCRASYRSLRHPYLTRCLRTNDAEPPNAAWLEILYLKAELNRSVDDEDFASAARLRDEVANKLQELSPLQQYEFSCLDKLQNGTVVEKRQSLAALAQISTSQYVIARVAECFKEEHLVRDADLALQEIWLRHPTNADINDMMAQGLNLMRKSHTYEAALKVFDDIVAIDPTFAEGWNKRATMKYLLHRFAEAVEDCEKVIELQPLHFAALSGKGLCHVQLKEYSKATEAFEAALRINPSMSQIKRYVKALENGPP